MKPIYLTTDTHFNHDKLWQTFKERPENFEMLISQSHKKLPEDCTLIHLGDVGMGQDTLAHEKWNQATNHVKRKILVRGNHDGKSDSWYYDNGWDFVCSIFIISLFGERILFSHIPKENSHYQNTTRNLHGHTHGNTHRDEDVRDIYDTSYHIEIALEHSDYRPILLTEKLVKLPSPPKPSPLLDGEKSE